MNAGANVRISGGLRKNTRAQRMETQAGNGAVRRPFSSSTKRLRSHAAVRIPRRLRAWSRSAVVLFLIFGHPVTVSFVPWTQTVTVQGRLSAYSPSERPQEIHAQINGRIRAWHVNEGMAVKSGDLVLELDDVNPQFMAPDLLQRLQSTAKLWKTGAPLILAKRLEEMTNLTRQPRPRPRPECPRLIIKSKVPGNAWPEQK